jgi:uncharacterized protein
VTTVIFIHSAGPQGPGQGSSRLLAGLRAGWPGSRLAGCTLDAPPMPRPDAPEPGPWIAACRARIAATTGDLILAGHSLGGSVILATLAAGGLPAGLRGVVTLASPFWGPGGWDMPGFALPPGAEAVLRGLPRLVLLQGEADEQVAAHHPDFYRALLPRAEIRRLPGVDHEAAAAAPALLAVLAEMAP